MATQTKTISNPSDQSGKGFVLIVAAILVVGLAAVAWFVTTRGEGAATAEAGEQVADIEIAGDALSPMPGGVALTDPQTEPSFGQVAPTLVGTDFDGNEFTITGDGTPKVIYFLAHWCPHCQREVPQVQSLIESGQVPADLEIYAVSTAVDRGRGNFPVSTWLEEEGFTPQTMRDNASSSALVAYGNGGFPYAVYLDGENRVVARSSGELGADTIASVWAATANTAQ
ncbi:MAG: redoxin domain-containing protein [Actinomycetota bacterium]